MQAVLRAFTLGLVLLVAGGASAALIDDARLAAAKRAADEFVRRAEGSKTSGQVPRRTDPAVAALLDTVFDDAALGTGVLPISESGKIGELLASGNRVGLAYLLAGTGASDLTVTDPKALERTDRNVVRFAPEVGQWFDFQMGVQNALAASTLEFIAKATPAVLERANVKSGLGQVRQGLAQSLNGTLQTIALSGLDDAWRSARLDAMTPLLDNAARLLTLEDATTLRKLADEVVGLTNDPAVQAKLKEFGRRITAQR